MEFSIPVLTPASQQAKVWGEKYIFVLQKSLGIETYYNRQKYLFVYFMF